MDENKMQNDQDQVEETLKKMTDEVEIPESLRPENVEEMLRERAEKKKKQYWKRSIAAAASLLVVCGVGYGGYRMYGQSNTDDAVGTETASVVVSDSQEIAQAQDYDQIYEYIEETQKAQEAQAQARGVTNQALYTAESAADMATGAAPADTGGGYSDTNVRQEGVGEADIIKTNGKQLYILNDQQIQIVGIDQQAMEDYGTILLEDAQYVSELYLKEDKLIIFYTQYNNEEDQSLSGVSQEYAVAETYDVSDPKNPKSLGTVRQSGSYDSMREVGGYIYMISKYYIYDQIARNEESLFIPTVQDALLPSGNIYMPPYARGTQYTVLTSFAMDAPEKTVDSKAVFGCSGMSYVSTENMYICESFYDSDQSDVSQTSIRKIAFENGKLQAVGQTKLDGTLNDSFSIDEYDGNLRLVTTVSATGGGVMPILILGRGSLEDIEVPEDSNSLYVLDKDLKELAVLSGLAEGEQIYSARFMGDTGYFVTYEQIDPLFSVDLTDPKNPEILGELKIPGFSDYLHPYGDGLLLGIGMDVDESGTVTNGVKLSMFDISDPSDVQEVQKYVLEQMYSTDVAYNYKAVLADAGKNLIGFTTYGDNQYYSVFSYEESGFNLLFQRKMGMYGASVRGIYADDRFYLIAGNTIESYDLTTFEKLDDIVL